jgi:tetratricopeptide (TPR) repeat protein
MARVAELMEKIQADPKDVVSLQALADIYFLANEFETAGGFLEKILSIDSQDLTARLALGAVLFNIGQPDDAEDHWRQVLAIDPDNLEAHYDLGFLYLSRDPADVEQAKLEWARVVEIAPDSDIAKSVQQHLASFETVPAPSEGASPEPTSGTSPAPATSPAPSGE